MDTDSLIDMFRSRQEDFKADSTADSYSRTAKKWAEWLANPGAKDYDQNDRNRDAKTVYEATDADIRMFLRYQLQSGLTGGTVRNRRWAITAFYKELERMAGDGFGIPEFENPAEGLDLSDWKPLKQSNIGKKKEELKDDVTYLKPEEIKQLAENVTPPIPRNELIIRLLYQTGLRRGELSDIRLEDIDRDNREIDIHAEKTHLNRTVYYKPKLDTQLNRWVNVERKSLVTAGSEYLFPTYKSEQISPEQVNRTVRKAADNAGLQEYVYTNAGGKEQVKITAHVLRHSFAMNCLKNDMDSKFIQELMGHAKIETTERYLNAIDDDIRNAYRTRGPPTA
ncbi:site-specific integrase [Halobacterium salinarum]|uniref:tyrosine-type recombinase/integrase n=1 Tax=Halobacterium salinarum TaxID=2242 RepID=UPI002552BB2F|nr:site-specific integrase [Halobacterium salinarum]MDL0137668.1 site-specific integrase [Halobacterium salinarum]MDL0140610.1 site-specific integrase [Halobacterium salinarum]